MIAHRHDQISPDCFPLAIAAETLKLFRRSLNSQLAAIIEQMEAAIATIDDLPPDERRAAAVAFRAASEELLKAVRQLAEVGAAAAEHERPLFQTGAIGHG